MEATQALSREDPPVYPFPASEPERPEEPKRPDGSITAAPTPALPRFLEECADCTHVRENALWRSELVTLRSKQERLLSDLESARRELRFLNQVNPLFQVSTDPDEVMAIALTAITSGKGFGLNRAILLLIDPERKTLRGSLAVGPRRREEAARIWHEIEEQDCTLIDMARRLVEQGLAAEKAKFKDLLEQLSIPLDREDHLFVRSLNELEPRYVEGLDHEPAIDPSQLEALGVRELVLVPIANAGTKLGLLLADNMVNDRRPSAEELQALASFGHQIARALDRTQAQGRLQEELQRVAQANRELEEQQELAIRREKMALAEEIAAAVAHSIRNPVTVIGGFARRLSRNAVPSDPNSSCIDSIIREASRLEEVLLEVLAYSDSTRPSLCASSVNELVRGVVAGLQELAPRVDTRFACDLPCAELDPKKAAYCLRTLTRRALEVAPPSARAEIATCRGDEGPEIVLFVEAVVPGDLELAPGTCFAFPEEIGSGRSVSLCARLLEGQGATLRVEEFGGAGVSFRIGFRPAS
jgi:GAF domain-containing protein